MTFLLRPEESAFDAEVLLARLAAHGIDARRSADGWVIDVEAFDTESELAANPDSPEEALCRAIVDAGRIEGQWPVTYRAVHSSPVSPLFSVIIATHARPAMLRSAVRSACAQLVTAIEVIVVDDASPEPVGAFDDDRVRTIRLPSQRGPAGARNAGLDVARGRYVAFLDDDDLWLPERLDLALRGLRRAPVAICWTKHIGRPDGRHRVLEGFIGDRLFDDTAPGLGATAVRRELSPRFDESYRAIEDLVWWWTLAQRAPVTTVPEIGYLVRLHESARSVNTRTARVAEKRALLEGPSDMVRTRASRAYLWLRVAIEAREEGDHRTALIAFVRHLRARPRVRGAAHIVVTAGGWALSRPPRHALPPAAEADPPLRALSLVASDRPRGAERAATFLRPELAKYGISARVVALRGGPPADPRARVDDVLIDHHKARGVVSTLRAVRSLRRELRHHPVEVILAHGAEAAFVACLTGVRRAKTPVVWQRILHLPDWPGLHPNRLRLMFIARRVRAVVAITETTDDEVRALGFRGPVWQIPNHRPGGRFGTEDRDAAGAALRSELQVPADAPLLGFVGHLVHQKAPTDAIEILDRVHRVHPRARLVVVGDGPLRAAVGTAVRRAGLDDYVSMLGHLDDVARVLSAIDLLVVTSRIDSMPGVVIEAQLSGTPVVSYPVDGIEAALEHGRTGLVTTQAEPDQAAAAVATLLSDPDTRSAMTVAAFRRASGLTTAHVAERYARMIRSIAVARGTAAARVLHVIPDFGVGGAEQTMRVLATHLHPDDVRQDVCVVHGTRLPIAQTVFADLQAAGVPMCDLGVRRRATRSAFGLIQSSLRLRGLVKSLDATVVDAELLDASLPARVGWLRRPLVTHLINTPWSEATFAARGGPTWRDRVLKAVDRLSSRRDDALIALNNTVAEAARHDLALRDDDPRLLVVPLGVDLERFSPPAVPVAADDAIVVTVGRLVAQKGHDTLIAAARQLGAQGVPLRLLIAGEGPLADELRRAEVGAPAGTVEFLGAVQDVAGLLRRASVFALASRWEGLPNAVLEAMAVGLPVVVSDIPALREVVGEAGLFVPPDDSDAWAKALASLLADPDERQRLGELARIRALSLYDARQSAARLASVYLRLGESKRRWR